MQAFIDGTPSLSLADLASRTGLHKSTILRLISSLEHEHYISRLSNGHYQLGPTLLTLGNHYQNSFNLAEHVNPALKALVEFTSESAAFYVRDGDSKICLFRANSFHHGVLRYIQVGYRLPVTAGASGAIIMAFTDLNRPDLAEVRNTMIVVSLTARLDLDTAAISCPVFGVGQHFQGALALAGPRTRFTPTQVEKMKGHLVDAAISITHSIGGDSARLLAVKENMQHVVL
ncbi:IclR family transcriptional regulator [Deinococcus sp. QL22]|uniref:IclR family transcriptional regulator n=1 Tax=Deinococcus sp. QL22 TaxID=2939437 RepID=UPI002016FBD6|nr:helix-turn-helix domain-containing protein [Deinococcus sp. QL22]UQN08213.1 helix-turn-helix domain-containing protein [Deinococcus sp. QL22]